MSYYHQKLGFGRIHALNKLQKLPTDSWTPYWRLAIDSQGRYLAINEQGYPWTGCPVKKWCWA